MPPLNWRRVPSSEDNSVFKLHLFISAGELNHLPALFSCHLCDAANRAPLRCFTPRNCSHEARAEAATRGVRRATKARFTAPLFISLSFREKVFSTSSFSRFFP